MIEVADILREHFSHFLACYNIPYEQYKAVNALINCRTAALGAMLIPAIPVVMKANPITYSLKLPQKHCLKLPLLTNF